MNWAGEFFAIGATSPPPKHGIGVGDNLVVTFGYNSTLAALLTGLTDASGNARIAAHVLDCNGGNGCAAATVVPVPAALPLLLSALAGLFVVQRRRSLTFLTSLVGNMTPIIDDPSNTSLLAGCKPTSSALAFV